jgi:hypothetical protein
LSNYTNTYHPRCDQGPRVADFTYNWASPANDSYIIDTLGSPTDTVLAVYEEFCGKTELRCNDDDANGTSRQSRIAIKLGLDEMVTIVVTGYTKDAGDFELKINRASSLVDSTLPSSVPLSVTGTTVGKLDHSTSTCNGKKSASDYVYLYTLPESGTYHFVVESSNFDPVLSIRDKSVAGSELTCNDDSWGESNARITHAFGAGQTVALVIDGFEGSSGDFQLNVTFDTTDAGS